MPGVHTASNFPICCPSLTTSSLVIIPKICHTRWYDDYTLHLVFLCIPVAIEYIYYHSYVNNYGDRSGKTNFTHFEITVKYKTIRYPDTIYAISPYPPKHIPSLNYKCRLWFLCFCYSWDKWQINLCGVRELVGVIRVHTYTCMMPAYSLCATCWVLFIKKKKKKIWKLKKKKL